MRKTEPIRRRKLYEEIVARLEIEIYEGRLPPDSRLPSERELMDAYQVGRPSVREALFALQRMGLVSINSGERARVTLPTASRIVGDLYGAARHFLADRKGVLHFQQARMLFEVSLARFAAANASPNDIAELSSALEENRKAVGQPNLFHKTDVAFHFVLAKISCNPIFTALHDALADWLMEQRTTSSNVAGSDRLAYQAHKAIYDAIESKDVDGAERAMHDHLIKVNKYYWMAKEHEKEIVRRIPGRTRLRKART